MLNRKDTCNVSIVLMNEAGNVSLETVSISKFIFNMISYEFYLGTVDVSNITVDIGDQICIQCYFVNYATTEGCYVEVDGVTLVGITRGVALKRIKTKSERQCWKFSVEGSTSVVDIYVKDDINGEHWAFKRKERVNMTPSSSMFPTCELQKAMTRKYLLLFYYKDTVNSEKNSKIPWKLIIGIIVTALGFGMILIIVIILYKFQIIQYITNRIGKDKPEGK